MMFNDDVDLIMVTGQSDNNNLLDCSRHAPWPGQAGGGAACDSNKMGGVRTEGGAGGGWRAAGGRPRAVQCRDCQWRGGL